MLIVNQNEQLLLSLSINGHKSEKVGSAAVYMDGWMGGCSLWFMGFIMSHDSCVELLAQLTKA